MVQSLIDSVTLSATEIVSAMSSKSKPQTKCTINIHTLCPFWHFYLPGGYFSYYFENSIVTHVFLTIGYEVTAVIQTYRQPFWIVIISVIVIRVNTSNFVSISYNRLLRLYIEKQTVCIGLIRCPTSLSDCWGKFLQLLPIYFTASASFLNTQKLCSTVL